MMELKQSERSQQIIVADLLKARFPLLYFSTWEEDRAVRFIEDIVSDESLIRTRRTVYTWKVTTGWHNGEKYLQDSQHPIKALELVEKMDEPAVFILHDFHVYFGDGGRVAEATVIRKLRDLCIHLKQSIYPKSIIFISPTTILPRELEKDITLVDFDLPTFEDIKATLNEMITVNVHNGRIEIDLSEEDKEKLINAALGLTLSEAENAFARAMVEDGRLSVKDVHVILKEKEQIIKKTGTLEFLTSTININEVGGLENLKRWLHKRNKSWLESAQLYGLPAPKGVLITGVPGCGKSLISKAISEMWQLPLLRFDIGSVFGGLVGSSEENMRQVIRTAEAISPCILWIDEIEKGFSGISSNGDSGTSTRIFGHFLTWMQEKEKPVFVIATANNISNLPPEMLRKGRFDEIFFVDLPTKRERMEILKVHLNRRLKSKQAKGNFEITDEVLKQLANITEGFVGAEIEQVIINGLFEAFYENRSVTIGDFKKVAEQIVPLAVTQAEQIKSIREWANVRAVAATPYEDRATYKESQQPKEVPSSDVQGERGGRTIDF